ncbi:hypothetical protein [Clostridium sulfidigenes]|uniref:hypothetical protein n=1 Tax=Clostridium sulfidigenes TaxID=318464 RepID=UPI003F898B3A
MYVDYFIGDDMKTVENMIKAYWDKAPGAEEDLYNYFTPKVKQISYGIFNRNKDLSYDIDDYFQAGYLAIFEACNMYQEKGLPENIEASMYLVIKYRILNRRCRIKNKKGAILESFDKTNENSYDLVELLADKNSIEPYELIEKCIDNSTLRKELNHILKTKFDKLTSEIIKMKYGWYDDPKSDDYIGEELSLESDKVAAIHTEALCKFRKLKWTKEVGDIYLYGYKIMSIKNKIENNLEKDKDISDFKLYTDIIDEKVKGLEKYDLKSIWGL